MAIVFGFIEFMNIAGLLISIPEAAGLFVFGIVLVSAAILIRWVLRRKDEGETATKVEKRA